MTTPSLMVGSDELGWVELGHVAILGDMTKGMPGGDGSLNWALYGDDAMAARNVLVPGEAEVRLMAGGEPLWGGVFVSDPVRHRLSCQSVVECAAAGPYSLAARDGRYGYIGVDTDLEQWRQYRASSDHSGRFTVKKEGVLELRGDTDRTYANGDSCQLSYTIHDGLIAGAVVTGIEFEYKLELPVGWGTRLLIGDTPADAIGGIFIWGESGALSVSSWTAVQEDVDRLGPGGTMIYGEPCIMLWLSSDSGSPATDPWVRLRKVRIIGRYASGTTPAYDLNLSGILADLAAAMGITNTRLHADLAAFEVEQFVSRFPTDISETLRQACALYTDPLEVFCDLDPVALTRRFTARPRPADTALAPENRLWVAGNRAGEDTDGIIRDWEATPEQVTVLYACKDDADDLPDGTVRTATYPGGSESTWPRADVVDLTSDKGNMSAATAANYAQAIYNYGQSNRYTGEASLGATARTEYGPDLPTYLLRPGDRLTVNERDDTDRFGETLYVQGTSYSFRDQTCQVTIGSPFNPMDYAGKTVSGLVKKSGGPGGGSRYHVRTGIA